MVVEFVAGIASILLECVRWKCWILELVMESNDCTYNTSFTLYN